MNRRSNNKIKNSKIFKKKKHTVMDVDNIIKKITVHYHKFLVNFFNECWNAVKRKENIKSNFKFCNINWKDKKAVYNPNTKKEYKKLINSSIKGFFLRGPSDIYRSMRKEKDKYFKDIEYINTNFQKMNHLLNMNYEDVYTKLFLGKQENDIDKDFTDAYKQSFYLKRLLLCKKVILKKPVTPEEFKKYIERFKICAENVFIQFFK